MTDALLHEHIGLAHAIAGRYYIPGSDQDDVHQEAMIALWIASETWDQRRGPFRPFAALVIRRHLIDAVKTACREKHRYLTLAVRDPLSVEAADQREHVDLGPLVEAIKVLSPLERDCLIRVVINGEPYSIGGKRVDNAVQRARLKLRLVLEEAA